MDPISRRSLTVIAVAACVCASACIQTAELSDSTPTTSLVVTDTVHFTDVHNREPMVAELADGALLVVGDDRRASRRSDLGVVTPLEDARSNRYACTWWRMEMR